ncbi:MULTISPECIES: hypothetical protein [unclassified Streptomyces]|uniref:hypothetical protein n=1 Tax=unclassified Streptomyces TaxID=2593676 RepID=UPI001F2B2160|nr:MULTISPECIES: hypothetical protein [unclassified Streptomyces]
MRSVSAAATFCTPGELPPPGVRQQEVLLEDRVVGQDGLVGAHGQLGPVGGAVVDGVVYGQEGGPVPVQVTEGVLGIQCAVPQLPRRLVLRCGHQSQPRRLPVGGAGRGAQGAPGPPPELRARLHLYVQGLRGTGVVGAHAALGVRVRGRRVHR